MAAAEDLCLICTEPLTHVGVGSCGHKEVCGICTLRMRLVIGNNKCSICQVESKNVLITKHHGMFTAKYPGDREIVQRSQQFFPMKCSRDIYFDDEEHLRNMSTKCALTCRVCHDEGESGDGNDGDDCEDAKKTTNKKNSKSSKSSNKSQGGVGPTKAEFRSLKQLKSHLKERHNLFMCDVCLEGRKVFVQEQVLYTRSELARHYSKGDLKGPMAEAGFKGHPSCQFCKKHFYSDQELYTHMQTKHLQCFLCRRAKPNEYVYYKNLADLSNHFATNHHFCTHEACQDRHPEERAFASKEEFHVHYVQEHGDALSKTQKKQALQIEVNYSSIRNQQQDFQGSRGGAGAGAGGRGGRGGRGGNNQRNTRVEVEDPYQGQRGNNNNQMAPQAPPHINQEEAFPDLQATGRDGGSGVFQSLGASDQRWRSVAGGSHGNLGYSSESEYPSLSNSEHGNFSISDYPALPGMSKSAKKRAKAKAKAAAAVSHHHPQAHAVWNSASGQSSSAAAAATSTAAVSHSNVRRQEQAPQVSEQDRADNRLLMQKLRNELDSIVFNAFRQESASFLQGNMSAESYYKHIKTLGLVNYAPDLAKLCPKPELKAALLSLVEGDPDRQKTAKPRIDQREDSQKFVNLASILRTSRPSSSTSGKGGSSNKEKALNLTTQSSDFPSVSETYQQGGRGANQNQRNNQTTTTTTTSGGSSTSTTGQMPRRFQPPQNYTEHDKKANKELMEKLKRELDQDTFAAFRVESVNFLKGASAAQDYYHLIISLGLTEYLDSLANLCPDLGKRKALRDLHKASLMAQMQYSGSRGGGPSSSNPRSFAEDDSQGSSKKGKGKKKKKQGKFEKKRLGQGVSWDDALGISNSRGRTNPNNSWTQGSGNNLF